MKRRIVLILIIAGVLLLTGGGVWWYVRVNTGWRILAKAQMAIKANQFDNAIDLSADYVHRFPQDWQGYYWQAQGYLRQGKYPESRQCLDKILNSATPIPHDPLAVRILMADTYGDEANRFLSSPEAYRKPIGVDAALSQLEQALAQLEAVSPFEIKGQIDLAQAQAGHLMGVSQAHDIMAWIDQDARKTAGNTTVPSTAEGPSFAPAPAIDNRKMALGSLQKAVDKVVWVLSKDPSRGVCAQRAVEMCVRQQHVAGLEQLRTAVFALGDPPPAVAALLIAQEVQGPRDEFEAATQAAGKLDKILERHPEDVTAGLHRADMALRLGDLAKAEDLCNKILAKDTRNPEARFLHARLRMSKGEMSEAEMELFSLQTNVPRVDFMHAYALAAMANHNKGLALEAMRSITKVNPDYAPARAFLARLLQEEGFNDQAFEEARKLLAIAPNDPQAIRLFTRLARLTDQAGRARKWLGDAWKAWQAKPGQPQELMAMAEAYAILDDKDMARKLIGSLSASQPAEREGKLATVRAFLSDGQVTQAQQILADLAAGSRKPLAEVLYLQGRAYLMSDRVLQAIECFRQAVEAAPGDSEYLTALARALKANNQLDECQDVLKSMDPDGTHPVANAMRMEIQALRGPASDGAELIQRTLAAGQSGLPLALTYFGSGQPQQCVEACLADLKRNPDQEREIRSLLAQGYLAIGDRDHAVEQLKILISASPFDQSLYMNLASVLLRQKDATLQKDTGRIASEMLAIPKIRKELVELARGALLEDLNQMDQAATCYEQLAADVAVPDPIRQKARLHFAQVLARAGQTDKALQELGRLASDPRIGLQVRLVQAQVLLASNQTLEARRIVQTVCDEAEKKQDALILQRAVPLFTSAKDYDAALAVCDKLRTILPPGVQALLLKAAVLGHAGRGLEAVEAYAQAAKADPGNLSIRVELARAWDAQRRPDLALTVLDEIGPLGEFAQAVALQEKASLLIRSGLARQAADCLEELARKGYARNPRVQLMLGRALADLGRKDRATEMLKGIPSYAPEYLSAGQILVALADKPEASLAILDDLEKTKPGTTTVLQGRMQTLLTANRATDAAKAFQDYRKAHRDAPLPTAAAFGACRALTQAPTDYPASLEIAATLRDQTLDPSWKRLHTLLTLAAAPKDAPSLLPPSDRADLMDTAFGICGAALTGDSKSAAAWAIRFEQIEKRMAAAKTPVPPAYAVLIHASAGNLAPARTALADARNLSTLFRLGAIELVDSAKGRPNATAESSQLLLAVLSFDLGLPELASDLAKKALQARPGCHLAAMLALQGRPGDKDVLNVLAADTSAFARMVSAAALKQEGKFDAACKVLGEAVAANAGDADLLVQYGGALEGADKLEEALKVYLQAWSASQHLGAANNAAYLISVLSPADKGQLAKARVLAAKSLEAMPNLAPCRDTLGWILYLEGQTDKACAELRQSIRSLPNSPEAHYHVGMAEAASGNKYLARGHLQTAVHLGQELARQGRSSPPVTKAVQAAEEALKKLPADS